MNLHKQLWIEAYDEKYGEEIEEGASHDEADKVATEWAEGAFERAVDFARDSAIDAEINRRKL